MADGGHGLGARIPVTVCVALGPGRVVEASLAVRAGVDVSEVLNDPAVRDLLPAGGAGTGAAPDVGIWGRRCAVTQAVAAGDRIEIYRPLRVDPMTARRERFKSQGARATGLFASRAPGGGKPAD
jgi:sulfur carrier protein